VVDVSDAAASRCVASVTASLGGRVAKGKMSAAEKDAALRRIRGVVGEGSYRELNSVDIIIEAVTENAEIETKLLKQVDSAIRPGNIIATNTSSVSITKLAATTSIGRESYVDRRRATLRAMRSKRLRVSSAKRRSPLRTRRASTR
jgi:3-hydroxybutyryl-CoA dehydrogenase